MSVSAVRAVLDRSQTRAGCRLVMLVLAEHADHQGVAWPSVATIAAAASLSTRQVKRCLAECVRVGELTVVARSSQHHATRYQISIPEVTPMSPLEDSPEVTPASPLIGPGVTYTSPLTKSPEVTSAPSEVTSATARGDTHVTLTTKNHQRTTTTTEAEAEAVVEQLLTAGVEQAMELAGQLLDQLGGDAPAVVRRAISDWTGRGLSHGRLVNMLRDQQRLKRWADQEHAARLGSRQPRHHDPDRAAVEREREESIAWLQQLRTAGFADALEAEAKRRAPVWMARVWRNRSADDASGLRAMMRKIWEKDGWRPIASASPA